MVLISLGSEMRQKFFKIQKEVVFSTAFSDNPPRPMPQTPNEPNVFSSLITSSELCSYPNVASFNYHSFALGNRRCCRLIGVMLKIGLCADTSTPTDH